jgi:YHS domain-containing protein
MKTTLAAILAMGVGLMIGCSSEEWDEQAMQGDDVPMSRGGPRDDSTRLQDDPVCGRTVNPNTSVREVYDEQTFYFHDDECAEKFRENPHMYLPGGDDRIGVEEKDPVCGMKVDAKTAHRERFGDQVYYFCSKECADKFRANPNQYQRPKSDRKTDHRTD